MKGGGTHTIGRRKTAVARVYLKSGNGNFVINGKDIKDYINLKQLVDRALKPLNVLDAASKFDITVNVKGGGIKGQAEAISLGIAPSLATATPIASAVAGAELATLIKSVLVFMVIFTPYI